MTQEINFMELIQASKRALEVLNSGAPGLEPDEKVIKALQDATTKTEAAFKGAVKAALATLDFLGYTYSPGAEQWKPPLGKAPLLQYPLAWLRLKPSSEVPKGKSLFEISDSLTLEAFPVYALAPDLLNTLPCPACMVLRDLHRDTERVDNADTVNKEHNNDNTPKG